MSDPKTPADKILDILNTTYDWVLHFAAESAGAILVFLILPCLMLAALLFFGCLFHDAPIIPICLIAVPLSILVPLLIRKSYRKQRRMVQVSRASGTISKVSRTLILELSGSFTPYVIEAAEKLGKSNEPAVTQALLLVLEKAVSEQRAGWEDVSEAIIEALGNLGDPRALRVLESLSVVREICNLPALQIAIGRLSIASTHAQLLRPIGYDPTAESTLLRSAAELESDNGASLMRAVEPLGP